MLTRRGFARSDLTSGVAAGGLLVVMASLAFGGGRGEETEQIMTRDARHLQQLHQVMVIFSQDNEGAFPRPGLIDRHPDERLGQEVPGRGPEDTSANTTANLYAALIVQNFFLPELVVAPVERNPNVAVKQDYDYDAYDPTEDVYWDPTFTADLEQGSNASYAHLVIFGERAQRYWRATNDARVPVLGNRGPRGGEPDWRSYTCSPHGRWGGHLAFNDGHVDYVTTMTPEGLTFDRGNEPRPDNVFAAETGMKGYDVTIAFTSAIGEDGPELQYD